MTPPNTTNDPAWLRQQRELAWKTFAALPMPTRRDLDWQRFDIRKLNLDKLAGDQPAVNVKLSSAAGNGVIFCDMATALAKHPGILQEYLGKLIAPDEPHKFNALHAALWNAGAMLYVPAGVRVEVPVEILYTLTGATGFPRTLIIIEPGAEATVVQKFIGGTGVPNLHGAGTEVFVKDGGRLHYISYQDFNPSVYDFTLKRARVGKDAEIDWVIGMFGASFQRYDIECEMVGEGGTSFMYGVCFAENQQQFAQFTKQHHRAGNTVSNLLFKNVLRDAAVTNFTGLIKVEKNANGTNAYQSNKNLVLSDKVKCDTRPILEIESNKLRCTHGATVGRLDEDQLFYLRARGLPEEQARHVLLEAFLEPVLARIKVEAVYKEFSELIHRKVSR
ncbi:MAG: Fe-S cluster assembly protein SufD [Verrucomicrobiota bacterium]|jgi:Fe-S cluster assembly protein SufD